MKFKFSYESLLEHRKLQEEIARRDYTETLHALEEQKAIYKNLYTRLHEIEAESFTLQNDSKGTPIAQLIEFDDFMAGQKIKISRQREIVINHTQIVEGKLEILVVAAKETKILEKLKEKRRLEHKKLEAKKEAKRMDEVVVTRFKSGGKVA